MFDSDVAVELSDNVKPRLVDRQRYHLETRAAELGLQPVKRRHFFPTRDAPSSPDIAEHHLASEAATHQRESVQVLDAERGDRPNAAPPAAPTEHNTPEPNN